MRIREPNLAELLFALALYYLFVSFLAIVGRVMQLTGKLK